MDTHEHERAEDRQSGRQPTAFEYRRRFQWLNRFSDEELREISLCAEDEPLRSTDQYFDISHPERGVITGQSDQSVPRGSCFVARSSVTPSIWDKLISGFGH